MKQSGVQAGKTSFLAGTRHHLRTYNGELYLPELLQNLARLDLRPCELVVRDDGSTDSTRSAHRDREE
jgi:GT2 family glycosyltransferase